jgi:glycosyltransferase involved in cell wall biosynthesis
MSNDTSKLKVLLVPDSVHWVLGTVSRAIARFNPWIEPTICSGPILDVILKDYPDLIKNFDLVHFLCPYASKKWLPVFRDLVPCVTSHHHVSDWDLMKHNLEGDAIVVASQEWEEDLKNRKVPENKIVRIPYGVDADNFEPLEVSRRLAIRRNLGISDSSIVIGFFAKRSSNELDRKGIDIFEKALTELHDNINDLTVLIVGPGWTDLVTSFQSKGINCIWRPFIFNKDLKYMYAALDFYWVTSRIEGGPVTLLEAMSSGVCCVTTPVGLVRDIVKDSVNGAIVPFNNTDGFVKRTVELVNNPSYRENIVINARQTILEYMHVEKTVKRIVDLYAQAFENFCLRSKTKQLVDVYSMANKFHSVSLSEKEDVYMNSFPSKVLKKALMLEHLSWGEIIMDHGNQREGLKMIIKAWKVNPLSSQPYRILLRRLLPASIVFNVVRFKNSLGISSTVSREVSPQ